MGPVYNHYSSVNCSFSDAQAKKVPIFYPKLSSSTKILDCRSPKCLNLDTSSLDVPRNALAASLQWQFQKLLLRLAPHTVFSTAPENHLDIFYQKTSTFPRKQSVNFLLDVQHPVLVSLLPADTRGSVGRSSRCRYRWL